MNSETKEIGLLFEKGVRLLSENIAYGTELIKPTLFHSIRVGTYLYQNGYSKNTILAGLLHDLLEDTEITAKYLRQEFGEKVTFYVIANSKNEQITDKQEQIQDMMKRSCLDKNAAIIKAVDLTDNIQYYTQAKDLERLQICKERASIFLDHLGTTYEDKVFNSLHNLLR